MTKFIAAICTFFIAHVSSAQSFTGTGGNIPDAGTDVTCFSTTVSGVGTINGTYGLASVCLNITHTSDEDLEIYLKSPDGTTIPLSLQNGGTANNYTNTCFTSTATTNIYNGTAPFTGSFLPEIDLGGFNNGQNANGAWSLCVQDLNTGAVGKVLNWTLLFNNAPAKPPVAPTNDDPCTAFDLPVNNTCNFTYYTNVGTTSSAVPDPGCGSYKGSDVWFKVTVPLEGALILNTDLGTMTDADMAVYSGACNSLSLLACDDQSSGNGLYMPYIAISGQKPGTTLWVRVWGYGDNNTGTFQLCASVPPVPTTQDCPAAVPLCKNVYSESASYSGTGNYPNEIDPSLSCMSDGETADVWYTFTVQNSGNLSFKITPNDLTEDYDWAVFNLTNATCADIYKDASLNVSCNFSGDAGVTGPTGGSTYTNQTELGSAFNAKIPVLAGQTYAINVSNYSQSVNGYKIDFGASTAKIFDNTPPVLTSVTPGSACGGDQIGINFSENITCASIDNSDFTITGPGGPYTVTKWSSTSCSSGATYGNNIILTVSPTITTNGSYTVCLINNSGISDLCGNLAPGACLNFTVATTVPTFSLPGTLNICSGGVVPTLPTTSTNGFSGSWVPAVIDKTTSNTYTFTPGVGQCATPFSMSVVVTPVIRTNNTLSICPAQLPYTWNGKVFAAAKIDSVKLTSSAGCDSIAILDLKVTAIVRSNNTLTICPSQLPYTWNGKVFAAAKIDSVKLVTSGGCDSMAILDLKVTPIVRSNNTLSICPSQLPFTWNGKVFATAKIDSVTLVSSTSCDSIAILDLKVIATVRSNNNLSICQTQLPYTWNGKVFATAKIDSVKLVGSGGCDSIAILDLKVNATVRSNTSLTICPAQLPYTWNGKAFAAAKIDSVKLVSSTNCDSIAILDLKVAAIIRSNNTLSICPSQLPYTWNGKSFAIEKIDSVQLVTAAGCDSMAILDLKVTATLRTTINLTICQTQLPYTWNGKVFAGAKIDSVKFVSSAGCDSIAILDLKVTPTVRSNNNLTICQTQLPYTWNGKIFAAAKIDSVKLVSSANCDSIAILDLKVTPTVRSNNTQTICPSQLPYTWNGKVFAAAKIDSVKLVSAANCDSIAILDLKVTATVRSNNNLTICPSQLPYTWNGKVFANAKIDSVKFVSGAGCDSMAILDLKVTATIRSNNKQTICPSQLPYTWNGKVFASAKIDSVKLVSSAGCDSVAILDLTVTGITGPVMNFSYTPNAICLAGANPTLTKGAGFTNGGEYTAFPSGLTIDKNTGAVIIATSAANTYTITYTIPATACSPVQTSTTTITINSAIIPVTSFSYNTPVCKDNVTILPDLATGFTTGGVFSSTSGLSLNSNTGAINVGATTPGFYTIAYTVTPTSCVSAGAGNALVVVESTSTNTVSAAACGSYVWNGTTYTSSGIYTKRLTNNAGCDSVVTLNLIIVSNCNGTDIYFPTAFSPNGDNVNDYFGPLGNITLIKNYSLRVYNRFGEIVYKSTNPFDKWDGVYLGSISAPGNFVWYASYSFKGIEREQRGNVVLVK